jgi:class 3 adenylate cyclase/tetratricopeptide (TPR) repeat protein
MLPSGIVTFLFTDVEGSVRLWEHDAATMRAALQLHDQVIESLSTDNGGTLVRPRGEGDSRFAVFPEPARAIAAALDIQRALLSQPWHTSTPLKVRMALHTGEADIRDGDYYGSAPNRCARLRALAHGGEVFVSELTASLVRDRLPAGAALVGLGVHRLRDMRVPERVFWLTHPDLPYELHRLPDGLDPALAHRQPGSFVAAYPFPEPAELVGRQLEKERLSHLLTAARDLHVVLLGAPAGVGKSALLGELVRSARDAGYLCLAGGCYESDAVVPLRPFADALGDYLLETEPDFIRAELGPNAGDLVEIIPALRYHLDLPQRATPASRVDQLFGAVCACLRTLAQRSPVLLCVEDVHVADGATLDLLRFLARQARQLPLTLVATYRPDEIPPGGLVAQTLDALAREGAQQLELTMLDRSAASQLLAGLLGGPVSESLSRSLFEAGGGNPLFLEQLVLALREEKRLDRRRGVWQQVVEGLGHIPRIVQDVILARIDRLSGGCRQVLDLAAVLGRSMDHDALLAACVLPEDEVLEHIDEALAAQVLQASSSGYSFPHALVREALYWRLSSDRRMHLHAAIGATLEQLAGPRAGDYASALAHHFRGGGPQRAVRDKALLYSLEAGRRAAMVAAHREALNEFIAAWQLLEAAPNEPPERRVEALRGRAQAERSLGLWQDCIATSRLLLNSVSEPLQQAEAYGALGRALEQLGETAAAEKAYANGSAAARQVGTSTGEAVGVRLLYDWAFAHLLKGRYGKVEQLAQEMLASAMRLGDDGLLYRAHSVAGLAGMHQGQSFSALHHLQAALSVAESSGDKLQLAVVHENLGALHYRTAHLRAARSSLKRAVALYEAAGTERRAVLALQLMARVYTAEGCLAEASNLIDQARRLAAEAGDRWLAECDEALAAVQMLSGEWGAAESSLDSAAAQHEQVGQTVGIIETMIGLGTVYEHQGFAELAAEHYQRALHISTDIEICPTCVSAARHAGLLLLRQGQPSSAADYLERASTLVSRMRDSLEFPPTVLAIAELTAVDEPARAIAYTTEALTTARTVQARVEAYALQATIHRRLGNTEAAAREAASAVRLAAQVGSPWLFEIAAAAGTAPVEARGVG